MCKRWQLIHKFNIKLWALFSLRLIRLQIDKIHKNDNYSYNSVATCTIVARSLL